MKTTLALLPSPLLGPSMWAPVAERLERRAPLFPDAQVRAVVEAEQPRVPLSYFDTRVEVPAGWSDVPAAYVAFGDTYADEILRAQRYGWPVSRLAGLHLHMLVEPDSVATTVVDMLSALGVGPGDGRSGV